MRILILNYEFPPIGAGGGKASQKIAETLVEMGHTVRVVTARPTQIYSLAGNLSLLAGVGFWVYLAYIKINFGKDISDHGFTLLGTLLLLIGFILRHTALTWELTSPVRGLKRVEFINGVEIHRVPVSRRRQDYSTIWEMATFVLSAAWYCLADLPRFKPDLIHVFFAIPVGPLGWLFKRTHRLPYIISLRGADVPSDEVSRFATAYKVLRPVVGRLLADADRVVSVSNGLRAHAHQLSPQVPIEVITNAIDLSQYRPPLEPARSEVVRLIYVGRLVASKSPHVLLEALALLPPLVEQPFQLELVGEGDQRPQLENLISRHNLAKQVVFSGWVEREKLLPRYHQADIFVTATTWEGMPNTVLEAMATGLPIVGTRAPGLDQLVREGYNGYLVPLGNAAVLADRLARLINNRAERDRMGRESRKRAESQFSWPYITAQYVAIYEQVVGDRERMKE